MEWNYLQYRAPLHSPIGGERTVKNMLRQTTIKTLADHNVRIECLGKKRWHLLDGFNHKENEKFFINVFARNSITNLTSKYRTLTVTLNNRKPIGVSDNQRIAIDLNQTNNFTQILTYNQSSVSLQQKLLFFG